MGDPSHLEKMGIELKCPICLSLLNSAASLGCNHIFCFVCIEKSMKSDSNCPVCKVPYRRREVRPAPHMDNLVSIYKSMEAASGVNIFDTQNLSSDNLSDGDKQVEGDSSGSKRLKTETSGRTAYELRTLEKEPQKIQKSKRKNSASSPPKPSFPRKKRVQVPQRPLSETPTRPVKLACSLNEVNEEEPRKGTDASEDKGQPVLSPFFWLRERDEEDEKSNQESDLDQPTDSMSMNVLSFSDIKDSLEESTSKPPLEEVCGKPSNDLDLFDSEMFEWTQRACSPELCSSPFKRQVEDIAGTETSLLAAAPDEELRKQNPNGSYNRISDILDILVPNVPPLEGNSVKDHTARANFTRKGRKKKEIALKKCSKRLAEAATGKYSQSATETECSSQKPQHDVINSFGSLKNSTKRSNKKMHFDTDANKAIFESVPAVPINLATPNENFKTKTPAFPEVEKVNQFPEKSRKNDRASKKTLFGIDAIKATPENVPADPVSLGAPDGGHKNFGTEILALPKDEKVYELPESSCKKGRSRKKAHFGKNANKTILEDIPAHPISLGTPNDGPENFQSEVSAFQEVEKASQFPEKSSKNGGAHGDQRVVQCRMKSKKQKLDSVDDKLQENPYFNQDQHDNSANPVLITAPPAIATPTDQKSAHEKQEKIFSVCVITSEYDNITQGKYVGAQENEGQLSEKLGCSDDAENLDSMTKKGCSEKRERFDDEFQCAFCRSSEESEASGRMGHYFNGKPIDTDAIKNSKVVHAHWNCVEWAPNVYFDGSTAINLEAELSRSRRIKCGCCGNKGAALGCYEKNCRKSFHVPCAKLMPQCRWDTENFVMLCPLHPDSKLPSQDLEPQELKSSCAPKRQSNTKCIAVAREIGNHGRFTFRESSKKLVLCCSALTTAEREAVAEFQRLSGVPVLQKWDDSVTHIIASTDENGACKRTFKILMGILEGKWILGIEWIKACIQDMEQIEEERFEIALDVHGIRDGPQLGRLRVLNNQPKVFSGFKFFFTSDFLPSYKGYLQQLATAAGGTILLRKPVSSNNQSSSCSSPNCQVFIIYSLELPGQCNPGEKNEILNRRRSNAEVLAKSATAKVATNLWLLNSIASSKLRSLVE
ncbi:protein BREAST CANCER SUSCEPTIBILITY 1 homolog isoform X1 [Cucurbita pepo subsp. pepo]|uniref:protein BREAST CANCER SUSCEPTIBILITY 1 homolog isoform X1 n=1 Tax=Cucurbita pepo subsp. pepo TaxID=3664 RepID=UPI000C9D8E37|nr:protein BREAST CANCER SUSCEPTIBILITY 1 homolog isoform X1 [Cucurbita pepo subsp. pepo]